MRTIVTTSNLYLHLLPVFTYLWNKYYPGQQVTVLGYDVPRESLPGNFTFVSMGRQGDVCEWSTDIRKWVEGQDAEWLLWVMEDTFLKTSVNSEQIDCACALMYEGIGRIGLTKDIQNREHNTDQFGVVWAHPESRYRLSTQPSIWNKKFLLQHMTEGLTPWEFETQDPKNDNWAVVGLKEWPISHNEGVNKRDRFALDLTGMVKEDIDHINKIKATW